MEEALLEATIGYYEHCLVSVELVFFVLVDMNSVAEIEYCSEIVVVDFGSCLLERAWDFGALAGVPAGFH